MNCVPLERGRDEGGLQSPKFSLTPSLWNRGRYRLHPTIIQDLAANPRERRLCILRAQYVRNTWARREGGAEVQCCYWTRIKTRWQNYQALLCRLIAVEAISIFFFFFVNNAKLRHGYLPFKMYFWSRESLKLFCIVGVSDQKTFRFSHSFRSLESWKFLNILHLFDFWLQVFKPKFQK